jgi:hypothetical protein
MKKNYFSSTRALKSVLFSLLCIAFMALAILANPNSAMSTDRLIVTDPTGSNTEFAATDSGTIRLNSATLPSNAPGFALAYGSLNNDPAVLVLDSYGYAAAPGNGGGGLFRFARGTQAAPTSVSTGDRLGYYVFAGYDGTEFVNTSGLTSKVDSSNVSTNFVPAKLVFETIAQTGETTDEGPRVERLVISSKGYVAIGGSGFAGTGIPAPSHVLQVFAPGTSGAYAYSDGATWLTASSRAYKENINALTTEEADRTLEGLNPVKYNYKADKENKHVGFIAEDVPDLVATKDRKGLSPMDIVAVLTKVVQEQKNMISDLSKKVEAMQKEINRVKGMNIIGSADSE